MNKIKNILILTGLVIIFGYLASFILSRSPLDLFLVTVGMMTFIFGYYIENKKVNEMISYFVAMSCVNILQWIILIYTFFISRVYDTENFFYFLVGALLLTIALIIQIHRRNLKNVENPQKINNDILVTDKRKLALMDKTKIILILGGILIILGCLASYSQSLSFLELFGASVGMILIIYGFYRKDRKLNITLNYFFLMSGVIIFQWFILAYIFFSQIYVGDTSYAGTIAIMVTLFFYIQIRESDLKYIGKMRK